MTDFDRTKDRQGQNTSPALNAPRFLSRRVWGRASATTKTSTGQEEIKPQSSIFSTISRDKLADKGTNMKAVDFHLDEAIQLINPNNDASALISEGERIEYVKATAIYLGNAVYEKGDGLDSDTPAGVDEERTEQKILSDNIRTLYTLSMGFAACYTNMPLRIAGLRLLASLLLICPPTPYITEDSCSTFSLPETTTMRSVYEIVIGTSNEGSAPSESKLELLSVQVDALWALTRGGVKVESLAGIVGWLIRHLGEIKEDWAIWCASGEAAQNFFVKLKPFDPIPTPTVYEIASSIIDLVRSICSNSIALLDPNKDIPRIIEPVLGFVARGLVSSTPPDMLPYDMNYSRRESIAITATQSPIPHAVSPPPPGAVQNSLRRAVSSSRRSDTFASTSSLIRPPRQPSIYSSKSPSAVQSPTLPFSPNPFPRWLYILPNVCTFFEIFIDGTVLPKEIFVDIMSFACICVACDEDPGVDVSQVAVYKLLTTMFKSNSGRRGEHALTTVLEEEISENFKRLYEGVVGADHKVVQGAVFVARNILLNLDNPLDSPSSSNMPLSSLSSLSSSFVAALSTTRFIAPEERTERARWEPVDFAILALVQDYLQRSKHLSPEKAKKVKGNVWTEGQAACDILKALVLVAYPHIDGGYSLGFEQQTPFALMFDEVCHQIPDSLKPLVPPKLKARFTHPSYIELLLSFDTLLTESDAAVIIDYYQDNGLCIPIADAWIENNWSLLNLFYFSSLSLPEARKRLASFLFSGIYGYTEQLSQFRNTVVSQVIIPFLEKALLRHSESWFRQAALDVLVKATVMETFERNEERRQARSQKNASEVQEEDASTIPSQEVQDAAAGGNFHGIRSLILSLATSAWCKYDEFPAPRVDTKKSATASIHSQGPKESKESVSSSSGLKGLMSALSPPMKSKELPSISAPLAAATLEEEKLPPLLPPTHSDCHSLLAVRAMITIFNQLAFSPPHSLSSSAKAARTPASSRCITVYRDLLDLLYPLSEHSSTDAALSSRIAAVSAKCPKARVTILQWLFRLRADFKHRIYFHNNIDEAIRPFAETLCRTQEAVEAQKIALVVDAEEARAKARAKSVNTGPRESMRERASTNNRSRSRSRPTGVETSATADYNPLWSVPETLAFDILTDRLPSEGLLTYDPNHPSLRVENALPVEGVWLPVSEYVACLNGILKHEKNWEVVSYVLCFLPLQLSNKLFFRGGRATEEVKQLMKELCSTIQQDNRIERRCKHHAFIKRPNVNAAVYQILSILISYKDVLDSTECDRLIAAFETCLESNTIVAKPCIQGLTLCVYEMEQSVAKRLLSIINKLRDINLTSGIAVHLLEFLLALGQHYSLFRNFTDAQYKDVFTLVIDYIAEHNARSDELPDMTPDKRQSYTLSQHVIGLAYHAIYVWFLALKLSIRPDLVKHIIVKLLQSRSKRVLVDEMAEVCLDWLARYTYANADPKPASSFLAEMVMQDPREGEPPKKQSWFLGGAIISITSHPRSGWASITTIRPTGTTEMIAKLENVPLLELEETNADLFSLPSVLMANRQAIVKDDEKKIMEEIVRLQKGDGDSGEVAENSNQWIWSGATPSQRRKDVAVDPAYLALQLLSSYPNASLEVPRGQLIPNEEKYMRSLRTIENTPVIDSAKLGVLYIGPDQTDEQEILGNIDGSSTYLEFLSGLGRLIRLKGQVDVFTGGLNRSDDSDGEYSYAWWDDLTQTVFHTATMMPINPNDPKFDRKKRLIGNDFVKIIYNECGMDFAFDTIKTAFNFINIVISPHTSLETYAPQGFNTTSGDSKSWATRGRDNYFKVIVQRAPGIPEFSPVGEFRIVSKSILPVFVRQIALMANDMAARFAHIRNARTPVEAEYITSWRSRLRTMNRLREMLPPTEKVDPNDEMKREEMLRDFTRLFSQRTPAEQGQ
ncbi:uncharacterized protein L203_100768 [Cryptococcus depauperatus CBS 7841]|uniref:Rap-GAP domain-containing protein n=1 Tax=Cryptococcus depauperatus CBS 7841 TaxID=1295531 RepID=A0AAJ8JNQ4_9TREE